MTEINNTAKALSLCELFKSEPTENLISNLRTSLGLRTFGSPLASNHDQQQSPATDVLFVLPVGRLYRLRTRRIASLFGFPAALGYARCPPQAGIPADPGRSA